MPKVKHCIPELYRYHIGENKATHQRGERISLPSHFSICSTIRFLEYVVGSTSHSFSILRGAYSVILFLAPLSCERYSARADFAFHYSVMRRSHSRR